MVHPASVAVVPVDVEVVVADVVAVVVCVEVAVEYSMLKLCADIFTFSPSRI